MHKHRDNAKWLKYFAPFRALSISAAYLIPFFMQNGLTLPQIFILQSIFSIALIVWELPSGFIADRLGRAFCIKLSVPIGALSLIVYGLCHSYGQFVACELGLALANGLVSGIDSSLLYDSLLADGRQNEATRWGQRIKAWEFGGTAAGALVAIGLVHYVGLRSTVIADGVTTAIGGLFAFRLVEAPHLQEHIVATQLSTRSAWRRLVETLQDLWGATKALARVAEARWLLVLGMALNGATWLGFWLSVPYYQSLGIPAIAFSSILAVRSLVKMLLSRFVHQERHLEANMFSYATLAGLVFLAMAARQPWLAVLVVGHDVVQALNTQPVAVRLNAHIATAHRATLNSLVSLLQRLVYTLAGPVVGLVVVRGGLSVALAALGVVSSGIALLALIRLHPLKTFRTGA